MGWSRLVCRLYDYQIRVDMDLNNYRVNDDRMAVPLRGNRSSRNSTQVFFKSYPTFLKVPIGLVIRSKLCKKNNRER